jgi:3-oxoacyl-(acyl-carrier-protein) synthase
VTGAIAITGIGALTPLGDSPMAIFEAVAAGRVGLGPIADFEATRYANIRGMRMYNRTTRLAICATKLALTEAKIETPAFPGEDLGVLMASTHGHLDVLLEYDRSLVASGVQRTNGALMPLAIPSAPGAMVALSFGAKAFSMTLGDGGTSLLDAIALGARWVAEGRARACVAVGAFSASPDVELAAARAGITSLGEGAVALVLERAEDAVSRGVEAWGFVRGYGAAFAGKLADRADALRRASLQALAAADVQVESLDLASLVKAALGETFDAAGGFQALVALAALRARKVGYGAMKLPVDRDSALITEVSRSGGCSALVLSEREHGRG